MTVTEEQDQGAGPNTTEAAERRSLLLRDLRDVVGFEQVRDDDITIERYSRSTSSRSTRATAVVTPASADQVARRHPYKR